MLHSDALQSASVGLPRGGSRLDDTESINFEAILRFLRKRYHLFLAQLRDKAFPVMPPGEAAMTGSSQGVEAKLASLRNSRKPKHTEPSMAPC